ncbi:MAG TPA: hypothetical protein VIJ96_19910 [Acidothermaceae bacterium]
MAKYLLNTAAVTHCRKLIDAHQYVVSSDWRDVQPAAEQQNDYLEAHSWPDFSLWHLGLTSGEVELAAHDLLQHLDRTRA